MTMVNRVLQLDGREFTRNHLEKLVNSIEIADEIAAGTFKFSDLSDPERMQLADQLAQAAGILGLCSLTAKEQQKSGLIIEMYTEFRRIFAMYAFQSAMTSGAPASTEDITEHLTGIESLVGEHFNHYKVDPVALHRQAMDLVGGRFVEEE